MTDIRPTTPSPAPLLDMPAKDPELWRLSQSLETTFLSEMLGAAGLTDTSETFNGGIGEEQFSSFLNQQRAAAMVESGGIGLAETIYSSLVQREVADDGS